MGVHKNVSYESFPIQGSKLGKYVMVSFDYHWDPRLKAKCIRDDMEDPFVTIFQLEDGRCVLATECQYSLPVEASESKTDYEGDRALAKTLLEQGDAEAIAKALRESWHRGYRASSRDVSKNTS